MSVQITVRGMNISWKRVYNFEKLASVSFGNLKTVVQADDPTFAKDKQIFVYMGRIVASDEILLYDPLIDVGIQLIELSIFVANFNVPLPRNFNWKIDEPSVYAAKKHFSANDGLSTRLPSNVPDLKTLIDSVSDECLTPLQAANTPGNTTVTRTATESVDTHAVEVPAPPVAAPAAVPAPLVPAVPALVLPVVDWFQWGVMARLILVAVLFTYNRNLNTEKLAHMAAMTLFSYLFQIGAFGYLLAWLCHQLGINFNLPVEPIAPVPVVPEPEVAPAEGVAVAPGDAGAEAGEAGGNVVPAAPVGGVGFVAPQAPAQQAGMPPVAPAGVPVVAPAVVPAVRPRAPLNAMQYLNQLCRDGFTIPTAPGIFLDVVSFFMGLFFSIVPSWAPYRLHR